MQNNGYDVFATATCSHFVVASNLHQITPRLWPQTPINIFRLFTQCNSEQYEPLVGDQVKLARHWAKVPQVSVTPWKAASPDVWTVELQKDTAKLSTTECQFIQIRTFVTGGVAVGTVVLGVA